MANANPVTKAPKATPAPAPAVDTMMPPAPQAPVKAPVAPVAAPKAELEAALAAALEAGHKASLLGNAIRVDH
jgi:hypothetical protein